MFGGAEQTLVLCFKKRKIAAGSLRLIKQATWAEVLRHAQCEIRSSVESAPVAADPSAQRRDKQPTTRGLTGYLHPKSSLFVSDTTLYLKTRGHTAPLKALEPILGAVVKHWQRKTAEEYLSYITFSRLEHMLREEQPVPRGCWAEEVAYLDRHFRGESAVLGSEASAAHHVYVANYLPQGDYASMAVDAFSTQVALTGLDPAESGAGFAEAGARSAPLLSTLWNELHGDDPRSLPAHAEFDEVLFPPGGYSGSGVFGAHFTVVHLAPQPGCSRLTVDTTAPMPREARRQFLLAAEGMCRAEAMTVVEFSLSQQLFGRRDPPEVPGFRLQHSSQSTGPTFGCALHHLRRQGPSPQLRAAPATPRADRAPPQEVRVVAEPGRFFAAAAQASLAAESELVDPEQGPAGHSS